MAAGGASTETAEKPDAAAWPMGEPGSYGIYVYDNEGKIPSSVVVQLGVELGEVERKAGQGYQWLRLDAYKMNGEHFRVWLLAAQYPPERLKYASGTVLRYVFQEGNLRPLEYVDRFTGKAVLPSLGFWRYQFPRPREGQDMFPFPLSVKYLGLPMRLDCSGVGDVFPLPNPARLELLPDLQIGAKGYSVRDKREFRRYDRLTPDDLHGRYEMVPYERSDYPERIAAGETTFHVRPSDEDLVARQPVFYSGIDAKAMKYPESLYRSNFLGGVEHLDEPTGTAAGRLRKMPPQQITPEIAFEEVKKAFREANYEKGSTTWLLKGLKEREDVDVGDMSGLQSNIYTWDGGTFTAAYQLKDDPDGPPCAIINEWYLSLARGPAWLDRIAEIQIPTNDEKAMWDFEFAHLRGAARVSGKKWGVAIYGADLGLIREALRKAYDAGASYFVFWTTGGPMHVPYLERLDYARFLRLYAEQHPDRDMEALKRSAEVMILYPPGYAWQGDPMWWGIPATNLERKNRFGLKYREILHRVGMEIERCHRLGISYDLAWDMEGLDLSGYREVVRVKEDGTIHVTEDGGAEQVLHEPRPVHRPSGVPPRLDVVLSKPEGRAPTVVTARATVSGGSAPIYYAPFQDEAGVWRNQKVAWELYGPEEWDYTGGICGLRPFGEELLNVRFRLEKPGRYRLRATAIDLAGRTTVVWKEILVRP